MIRSTLALSAAFAMFAAAAQAQTSGTSERSREQPRANQSRSAAAQPSKTPASANTKARLEHLTALKTALAAYRSRNGQYPKSINNDWTGLHNAYGPTSREWVPGLAPTFIRSLPRDPRNNENGTEQYLYKSNGTDYKLIAHNAEDTDWVAANRSEMVDPARRTYAYGIWTKGGEDW